MQTIGIDGSKDTLHVALAVNEDARNDKVLTSHKFSNNETGFKSFVDWMKKKKADAGTVCLMEVTGVYHEHLADWLQAWGDGGHRTPQQNQALCQMPQREDEERQGRCRGYRKVRAP